MKKRNFSIRSLFNKSFKIKLSDKKVIAFSLVELMISLIAISVIAAAFTPVISKRLKSNSTLAGGGGIKKECSYISPDCEQCTSQGCIKCSKKACDSGQSKDELTCSCIVCNQGTDALPNCTSCRYKSYTDRTKTCLKCKNGYKLSNTDPRTCVACSTTAGYTCDGVKEFTSCSARWPNCQTCNATTCLSCNPNNASTKGWNTDLEECTNCNNDSHCIRCDNAGCKSCELGYQVNPSTGKCILAIDLITFNGKQWTTKNAGDVKGPEIPGDIAQCKIGQACNTGGVSAICWSGDTSGGSCDGSSGTGYSGCLRTVCNWEAANKICEYYGMTLPTAADIQALGNANGQFLAPKTMNMCYIASTYNTSGTNGPANMPSGSSASKCADNLVARSGCGSSSCNPQRLWGQGRVWGETNTYKKYLIASNPCTAYRNDCVAYRADCTAYRNDCRAYRNDCRAYRNDCQAYRADCRAYRADCTAYRADCRQYRADCQAYRADCQGYATSGYTTFCTSAPTYCSSAPTYCSSAPPYCSSAPQYCSSAPQYCSSAPQYCSSAPTYCSSNPAYCSSAPPYCTSNPTYCSAYGFTYKWSDVTLTHKYYGTAAGTSEAFAVRCVK